MKILHLGPAICVCLCFAECIAPGKGCVGAAWAGGGDHAFVAQPSAALAVQATKQLGGSLCRSHHHLAVRLAEGRRRACATHGQGEQSGGDEASATHRGDLEQREDNEENTAEERVVERAIERRNRSRETPLSQKWFKLKQKSITPAQKRTLHELWPAYGLEVRYGETLALDSAFGRSGDGINGAGRRRRVLDIGFGTGDSIAGMAALDGEGDFLGVELHRASIAAALERFRNQVESFLHVLLILHLVAFANVC